MGGDVSHSKPVTKNKPLEARSKGTDYGRAVSSIEQREGGRYQEEQSAALAKHQNRKVSDKF